MHLASRASSRCLTASLLSSLAAISKLLCVVFLITYNRVTRVTSMVSELTASVSNLPSESSLTAAILVQKSLHCLFLMLFLSKYDDDDSSCLSKSNYLRIVLYFEF